MKKIFLIVIILLVGTYFLLATDRGKQEDENNNIEETVQKQSAVSSTKNEVVKKIKNKLKEKKVVDKNSDIVSNSKVLKDLIVYINDRNWKKFDVIYDTKIEDLRGSKDNTLFYQQFKNLFIENNLPSHLQETLLHLLIDSGTADSITLLYEMVEDGTIDDENVIGTIFNGIKSARDNIKKSGGIEALKKAYQTTTHEWMMTGAADVLGAYPSDDILKMLIEDYAHAQEVRKGAARVGLLSSKNNDSLPLLGTYLNSKDKKIQHASALTLSNMPNNYSSELLSSWVMEKATIDDLEDIKKWYKAIIQRTDVYVVTKNIVIEKIRDKELQDELRLFLEEQTDSFERMMKDADKGNSLK